MQFKLTEIYPELPVYDEHVFNFEIKKLSFFRM